MLAIGNSELDVVMRMTGGWLYHVTGVDADTIMREGLRYCAESSIYADTWEQSCQGRVYMATHERLKEYMVDIQMDCLKLMCPCSMVNFSELMRIQ